MSSFHFGFLFDFAFLCATLKASSAHSTCHVRMVDNALESSSLKVFDDVMNTW